MKKLKEISLIILIWIFEKTLFLIGLPFYILGFLYGCIALAAIVGYDNFNDYVDNNFN